MTAEAPYERRRGELLVSTDPRRLDLALIHGFLAQSYWAEDIPRAVLERAISHSLCFGLYEGGAQKAFARVVTDRATFAYLCDVFVLEEWRGRGLATWLMECVLAHPELQGLRRWSLATRDAHGLYQKAGFQELSRPETHMEILRPGIYKRMEASGGAS